MDEIDYGLENEMPMPMSCPMDINDGIGESVGIVEEYPEHDNAAIPEPEPEPEPEEDN